MALYAPNSSPIVKACKKCRGAGWHVRVIEGAIKYLACNKCLGARGRFGYRPGMVRAAKTRNLAP